MRISRLGVLLALSVGAIGCQTDDGGPVSPVIPPLAFVRYINAVPDSFAMDSIRVVPRVLPLVGNDTTFYTTTFTSTVRWIDQIEFTPQSFSNVAFRALGQGGYQGLEAGSRSFRIFTYSSQLATSTGGIGATTTQLADTSFNFVAGQYYTIVHARGGAGQPVLIYADTLPAASTANVQYRMVHLARALGAADFYRTALTTTPIAGAPTVAAVPEFGRSAYLSALPGAFAAQVTAAGSAVSLAAANAPAGVAGTLGSVDPIAGATVANSVFSAFAFPAVPAAVFYGRTFRAAIAPAITWYLDRQPPRMTTP